MKRILVSVFVFACLLLLSCGRDYDFTTTIDTDKQEVNLDTGGYILYIVNTSSRSYHLSNCYIVDNIKEENKLQTYDIDFITQRCYTPCKICIDKN